MKPLHFLKYYKKKEKSFRVNKCNKGIRKKVSKGVEDLSYEKGTQQLIAEKDAVTKRKVQLLNYREKIVNICCRDNTEIFKIGKTSAATIIENEEKLRKEYAIFQSNRKWNRHGKLH